MASNGSFFSEIGVAAALETDWEALVAEAEAAAASVATAVASLTAAVNSAQSSATSASISAANASGSEADAAADAAAAAASEAAALGSETAAASSASAASTSASNAATSESNASSSASSASTSASNASTSASNASTSASNASSSASAAASSASAASSSASAASTSASNAATSEANAAASETLAAAVSCAPNLLINPFMEFDQAGEGASVTTDSAYFADGWIFRKGGTLTVDVSRYAAGPGTEPFSAQINVTTGGTLGANDYLGILQKVEAASISHAGFGTADARDISLSFDVKCSIAPYTFCVTIQSGDGNRDYIHSFTINAANTWERKTVTIPGDTGGTWITSGTSAGLWLWIMPAVGSNFNNTADTWATHSIQLGTSGNTNTLFSTNGANFYVTNVKLEVSDAPTGIQRNNRQQELDRCKRYYQKSYPNGTIPGTSSSFAGSIPKYTAGLASATYTINLEARLSPEMRAAPTVTWYSPSTGASAKVRDSQGAADVTPTSDQVGTTEISARATANGAATTINMYAHYSADARL